MSHAPTKMMQSDCLQAQLHHFVGIGRKPVTEANEVCFGWAWRILEQKTKRKPVTEANEVCFGWAWQILEQKTKRKPVTEANEVCFGWAWRILEQAPKRLLAGEFLHDIQFLWRTIE